MKFEFEVIKLVLQLKRQNFILLPNPDTANGYRVSVRPTRPSLCAAAGGNCWHFLPHRAILFSLAFASAGTVLKSWFGGEAF